MSAQPSYAWAGRISVAVYAVLFAAGLVYTVRVDHSLPLPSHNYMIEIKSLLDDGFVAQAIDELRAATLLDQLNPQAAELLADVAEQQGDLPAALLGLRRQVRRDPEDAPLRARLANTLVRVASVKNNVGAQQHHLQLALTNAQTAIMLDPLDAAGHAALGNTYMALGQRAEAIDQYREALALDPDSAEARRGLGRARVEEGS